MHCAVLYGGLLPLLLLLPGHVWPAHSSLITSVSYVFEGFSPYAVLRFFDFNDKGWKLSENCLRDLYNYLEGLRHGALWAVKLYDASGYYGGGALGDAARIRIHNPHICRTLRHEYKEQVQHTTWSRLANATVVPFAVHIVMAHFLLETAANGDFKPTKIQQLICFPAACNNHDLQQILEVYLFPSNDVVRNSSYVKHRVLNDIYTIRNDTDFYVLIAFVCSSLFIYATFFLLRNYKSLLSHTDQERSEQFVSNVEFVGDFRNVLINGVKQLMNGETSEVKSNDVYVIKSILTEQPAAGDNQPRIVDKARCRRLDDILNAVSVHNVLYGLFGEDAAPQAGTYVLFTVLLIYEHLSAELLFMASNFGVSHGPATAPMPRVLQHASFVVDAYFFVHGTKLALQFVPTLQGHKLQACAQVTHLLKLVAQKTLGLLPSYAFCVFLEHLLVKYFYHNIALEIPSYDYKNCQNHKLSNLLYLDSFFPLTERCMPWTWFMSLEVQFFIVACLILLLAEIYPRYAVVVGIFAFANALVGATVWELRPPLHPLELISTEHELCEFHVIFDNICLRILPYAVGICFGYILQRVKHEFKLNLIVLVCGWIAYLLMLALFVYGYAHGYDLLWSQLNRWCRAVLTTVAHMMWSLMLLWISLTAAGTPLGRQLGDLLTFKYKHALERLSPISLLLAPIVIKLLIFTADGPIYTSHGQILAMFVGCVLATYMCAFVLHVLFDGPLWAVMQVTLMRNVET